MADRKVWTPGCEVLIAFLSDDVSNVSVRGTVGIDLSRDGEIKDDVSQKVWIPPIPSANRFGNRNS